MYQRIRDFITGDKVSGLIVIGAALVGLVLANSPVREGFAALASTRVGPASLHLDLTLATWAADGLLAIFFFVVGLELKHELVAGTLRSPARAAVPIVAAVGGMVVPALIYSAITGWLDPTALSGWAIPAATDIAFALAVLAIFGSRLPVALRTFLLTLAVVDDLLAIVVIAVFYTDEVSFIPLLGSLVAVGAFWWLAGRRRLIWWLLLPVGLISWYLMHESGVHATIAGVLLGLAVPARRVHGESDTRTHLMEHHIRPISAGLALPLFAVFSAAVTVVDSGSVMAVLGQPVVHAVAAGLVVGKLVGVMGTTALVTRVTRLRLPDAVGLRDLMPIGFLAGIGFTVSLLITELSFPDEVHTAAAKVGVLGGTFIAAALAATSLARNSRKVRGPDMNADGVPDVDRVPVAEADPDWTAED
ncbi:Na+/H+ antiporter NhaA [Tessaracoccus sp. OS52]|uniref:Na+/H+ antiporter NhaA n=1 Tax=Tessaracoccus sp. OS52 TaxID=2886691 RepID=UPI001D115BCD|nr:Na+/H+ antiporter NhaA [Tessaracoccus sp. OS52]MCC2592914.1 Na+/H+ antiporter NhaA [Tessaracoccus sp. OS52]